MKRKARNSHVIIALFSGAKQFCFLLAFLVLAVSVFPGQQASQQKESGAQSNNRLTKDEIQAAEQRLADLGYWTGKIDDVLDAASRQALIAFQKSEGRKPTGILNRKEFEALLVARQLAPRESGPAHVEVDLTRQILFMVDDSGTVSHILPISSGSGKDFTSEGWTREAVTPVGRFAVYNKITGWRKSPLGLLYYPNYITGGIAIHGNPAVPVRPASHGCIRIPMFAAVEFSRLTPIGTKVLVYESEAKDMVP